jgi:membrane protein
MLTKLRGCVRSQLQDGLLRQLWLTYQRWQDDDGNLLSAALAYFAACSFFPIVLLSISVLGFVLSLSSGAHDSQEQFLSVVSAETSAAVAAHLRNALDTIRAKAVIGGPLGMATLLVVALGMFVQIEIALDRIFATGRGSERGILGSVVNVLFRRLRAFLMLLGVGFVVLALFIAELVSSAAYEHFDGFGGAGYVWRFVQIAGSFVLNWFLFGLLYRMLPKLPIRWSEAMRGGALAAVLWEVSREVLSLVLLSRKYSAYGVVGSLLALILWFYVASAILLLGAEYVRVLKGQAA